MKIKTLGVSFNLHDPDQKELFSHASKRQNFSGYIKRLIQRDMEGVRTQEASEPQEYNLMKSLI